MIKEIPMYTAVCDNCKVDVNEGADIAAWDNKSFVVECTQNAGWYQDEDKHYCEDCYTINEDDTVEVNKLRNIEYIKDLEKRCRAANFAPFDITVSEVGGHRTFSWNARTVQIAEEFLADRETVDPLTVLSSNEDCEEYPEHHTLIEDGALIFALVLAGVIFLCAEAYFLNLYL